MQYLRRFSSLAPLTGKNDRFPTTDSRLRHSPIFSSTAEKFMASPSRFYYKEDDKISEPYYEGEERISELSYKGKDRISELPQNILDCIFDRLPVRDAAKTSILSRNWRHIWASYPHMVFDENFFKENSFETETSIRSSDFTKAVSKALLSHEGPIFKFSLHIPFLCDLGPRYEIHPEIDEWMLFLSRNGIKELEINNLNRAPYKLPPCIFSCSLSALKLHHCILKPPNEFKGFNHLINLELVKVSMSATLLQNTPLLKKFSIIRCTDVDDVKYKPSYVPKDTFFCMLKSGRVDWQWIAKQKQLKYVRIELGLGRVKNDEPTANMMKFLKNIPTAEELHLDGFSLEYLGTNNPHKLGLIHSSIKHIALSKFGFDNLPISSVLCLLKNCPSLMTLKLEIYGSSNDGIELITEQLELSNGKDLRLDKLQTVRIESMTGIKSELLLIKLLLSRSTCLQMMIIEKIRRCGLGDYFTISNDISRFQRASSSVKIVYI